MGKRSRNLVGADMHPEKKYQEKPWCRKEDRLHFAPMA
jgi:hypothetical protein